MIHEPEPYSGRDPLLERCGVPHIFGSREGWSPSPAVPRPDEVRRPRQVHGVDVVRARPGETASLGEGDAVVSSAPDLWIGVVTADCLPIFVASQDGAAVAAIHAGWRGLAAGIVAKATVVVRELSDGLRGTTDGGEMLVAAIGPHAGACCYEVDAPVLDALAARFGGTTLLEHSTATRSGHARIDLAGLAAIDLVRAGVAADRIGRAAAQCSIGHAERFHSFRRDAARSGRMLHSIAAVAQAGSSAAGSP